MSLNQIIEVIKKNDIPTDLKNKILLISKEVYEIGCNDTKRKFNSLLDERIKEFKSNKAIQFERYCLDKQKVKEAIERTYKRRLQTTDRILWQSKFKYELLKELGLDK